MGKRIFGKTLAVKTGLIICERPGTHAELGGAALLNGSTRKQLCVIA